MSRFTLDKPWLAYRGYRSATRLDIGRATRFSDKSWFYPASRHRHVEPTDRRMPLDLVEAAFATEAEAEAFVRAYRQIAEDYRIKLEAVRCEMDDATRPFRARLDALNAERDAELGALALGLGQ